jgi:hypothetical protein
MAAAAKRPRELFLSHSTKDRAFTARLSKVMARHGVRVWFAPHKLVGAQLWIDAIGRALRRCDWFAVVLSPNAVKSEWVRREVGYAIMNRRYRERIIPVDYRPCNVDRLNWVLSGMQFVRFRKGFDRGCRDLLAIWGIDTSGA